MAGSEKAVSDSRGRDEDYEDLIAPGSSTGGVSHAVSFVSLITAHVGYYWTVHRTEFVLGGILLLAMVVGVHAYVGGKKGAYKRAEIQHDWSGVASQYDLDLGMVDHWCLRGGDDDCRCEDPLNPSARAQKGWMGAHKKNVAMVESVLPFDFYDPDAEYYNDGYDPLDSPYDDWTYSADTEDDWDQETIDVIFLGDSITEMRNGRAMGKDRDTYNDIKKVFKKEFSKAEGGDFDGLALGIAGDTSPNLLWRIMHGEMPPGLNPKVWWVHIGINDLTMFQCSEEVVLLGILRVVEEIQKWQQDATIVVNSILPTTNDPKGRLKSPKGAEKVLRRTATVDLWPSIVSINAQLKKFADKHKKVKFFDSTEIFAEKQDGEWYVNKNLMIDKVHPNAQGHKVWGKAITKRLKSILGE